MEEKDLLDYLTTLGSVATPLLVIALGGIGWKIRSQMERRFDLEDKLRSDRIEIYNEIIEPFVILLMSDAAWAHDKKNKNRDKGDIAIAKMLSLDYRRLGFKLALMAPDDLVRSYNNLMQYFYNLQDHEEQPESFLTDMIKLLGGFLVEIRKSMGNEATELDHWDMVEWWMSDARKLKSKAGT